VAQLDIEDLHSLQTAQGLSYHEPEVTALIWELKYYANPRAAALAGELISDELLAIAAEELGRPLLVPVPMHKHRLRERGNNHTELLAQAALAHVGQAYEYAPQVLKRDKLTPEQQKLSRERRLGNVKDCMRAVYPELVEGRVCVMVDDVTTTGATLNEATRALKAAGALRVHTVSLAQS